MSTETNPIPDITSHENWQAARETLLAQEKAATRARDALAAERRRLPMWQLEKDYVFDGPEGKRTLLEVFENRRQLLMYHFMFGADWDAGCSGCSMMVDNIGHLAHLHARDVTFALSSRAPLQKIEAFKKRMGWTIPWYSTAESDFTDDFIKPQNDAAVDGEAFGLSVFLQHNSNIFQTYFTNGRGMEQLGSNFSYLDLVPFGRQENWEDSPTGWPQSSPYEWWRLHDSYE